MRRLLRLSRLEAGSCGSRLRLVALLGVVVVCWGCIPQAGPTNEKAEEIFKLHFKSGVHALRQGKSTEAVRELLAAQKVGPGSPDVEHALGLAYQQKNMYDLAVKQYLKALKLNPKLSEARNNLGTVYLVQGKFDKAIEQFDKCLADPLYETPEKAHNNLGVVYSRKGETDKAIEHFQKALKTGRNNVNSMFNLGLCYETKKDFVRAEDLFDKVTRLNPNYKEAYLRLGLIYFRDKKYDKAEKTFRAALKTDKNYFPARYQLASLLIEVGSVPAAIKELRRISQDDPAGHMGDMARALLKKVTNKKQKRLTRKKLKNIARDTKKR